MKTLIKCLDGILWSIFFFIGSAIVGALMASGLDKLLTLVNFFNPSSIHSITIIFSRVVLFFGAAAGFYIGYSRTLKEDAGDSDKKQLIRKLTFLVIIFLIIGIPGYIIYLNIRAYNKYGYYVYVSDENVFVSKIDPKNPKILDHGRMLKKKIIRLDEEVDRGDGQKMGKIRWYECYGIDCDEGWENRSYR